LRWSTFLRLHAQGIIACDFLVAVTATFRLLYVFVVIEHHSRRLKSPPRTPKANAICERVIGTLRRECLDWLLPLSEHHLRRILKSWIHHYNSLGRSPDFCTPGLTRRQAHRSMIPSSETLRPARFIRRLKRAKAPYGNLTQWTDIGHCIEVIAKQYGPDQASAHTSRLSPETRETDQG
jgi:hypothetical protein